MIASIDFQIDNQIPTFRYYYVELKTLNDNVLELEKKLIEKESEIREKYGDRLYQLKINRNY